MEVADLDFYSVYLMQLRLPLESTSISVGFPKQWHWRNKTCRLRHRDAGMAGDTQALWTQVAPLIRIIAQMNGERADVTSSAPHLFCISIDQNSGAAAAACITRRSAAGREKLPPSNWLRRHGGGEEQVLAATSLIDRGNRPA